MVLWSSVDFEFHLWQILQRCSTRTRAKIGTRTRVPIVVPVPVPMFQHGLVPVLVPILISLYPYRGTSTHTRTHISAQLGTHTHTHTYVLVPIPVPTGWYPYPGTYSGTCTRAWYPTTTLQVCPNSNKSVCFVTHPLFAIYKPDPLDPTAHLSPPHLVDLLRASSSSSIRPKWEWEQWPLHTLRWGKRVHSVWTIVNVLSLQTLFERVIGCGFNQRLQLF